MPDGTINPWVIAVTVTLATFMEVLDTSIANVALPHISGSLSAGADESTWVLTSYLVSNAIVLPLSGWLSSLVGRKRFYMSCVALFTVSSFLCGLAPSLGVLVLFRILQGAGGGGLQPSEQAILNDTFPLEKRGMAFAVYGIAVVVAPTIGPWLGGWITDNFSWRWIFYINIPVGIISLLLTSVLVSDPPHMKKVKAREGFRVDYIGIGLISLGLGSMQIILDKGQREDWLASGFIQIFAMLMVVGLIAAIVWELRQKDPVVDLRMLKNRNFAIATTAMFFLGFVLYSSTVLIPQMLQQLLGYTAEKAGLALSPGGAVIMVMMPVVGFLVSRVDARALISFGCITCSISLFVMAGWNLQLDYRHAVYGRMLQSFGLAFLFIPINVTAFAYVPKEKTNMGTGIINLARNIGASVGIATVTTMLERKTQAHTARLIEHVNPFSLAYRKIEASFTAAFSSGGFTGPSAGAKATGTVYGIVQRQAAMLSFVDIYKFLGVVFLMVLPVLLLLKRPKGAVSAPVH
ncbi:MAG TPA: DHA2 family efflux MFS transporter permease subunit [Candidatus Sulfotelmatobacter sp.]|jgi:DHA2 family multidrug resistance protein|nr:DHA2 family efflux MFS transporter permease subunit [Candidatus Sulfotelmatobacter sp.]